LCKHLEKCGDALVLDVFDPYAVNAGTASMGADCSPGPPQNIRPEDAFVARMASTIPAPLRRLEELVLAWS